MLDSAKLINIVLVETSHPGNIGSAARAMKNMGLSNLNLINPKKFPHGDARALSGNALDLLENALVHQDIQSAIANSKYVLATSARERSIDWPIVEAREAAIKIKSLVEQGDEISILFGREDRGLTNEELQLANEHLIIPADTDYPVLNLAMSVQLVCYEIHMAMKSDQNFSWQDYPEYTHQEIDNLIEHFNETAFKLGLVDKSNPKQILTRMERMFRRLHPDKMEGNFLRGFLTKVNKLLK